MKKKIPFYRAAGAGIVLFLFLFSSCGGGGEAEKPEEGGESASETAASAVEAVIVSRGFLLEEIEASGLVRGKNEAYVVAETQGIIQSVHFELGDPVTPQDVLLRVDDTVARLNLQQAEEQYETAKIDLSAKEQSFEKGNTSRAALLQARSVYNGAKAQYERALKALKDTSLASPISGFVASKDSKVAMGNLLSPGTPVARIVDLSGFIMEVSVGEGEVGLIENGAPVSVYVPAACEDEVLEGRVTAIAAGSDPATGSFSVIIGWENSCGGRIKAGMSAQAVISVRQDNPVLIVPSASLIKRDGREWVLVHREGAAEFREVQTGRKLGNRTEIINGLSPGEELLISGLTVLDQGSPVSVTILGESGTWK